jgi:uncharacterized phage-like protein YoqJ
LTKVVTISGYKSHELGIFKKDHDSVTYIKAAIRKEIISLLDDGLEWILISGQMGVELWAAEVVFDLQGEYPQLQLAVLTPFLDQESKWSDTNKEWYESVLIQADFVDAISKKPYEKPWQFRLKNQYFIEKSNALLLLYDTEKDGSPKYLYEMAKAYQQKHDYPIRLITFYDIQTLVEEEQYNHSFD